MKILSDRFFELSRLAILSFIILMAALPALTFLRTEQINYRFYVSFLMVGIYCLYLFRNLLQGKPIKIDFFIVFFLYMSVRTSIYYDITNVDKFMDNYRSLSISIFLLVFYVFYKSAIYPKFFFICLYLLMAVAITEFVLGMCQITLGYPVFDHLLRGEEQFELENNRNYFAYLIPGLFKSTVLASGTFHHFNYMGSFGCICTPIAYTLWLHHKKRFWFVCFVLVFSVVIITFSRGALLATLVGLFIIYISQTNHRSFKLYLVGIVAFIMVFFVSPLIKEYAEETGHAQVRYDTWVYAFNYASKHPENLVFGYGLHHIPNEVINNPQVVRIIQYENIMSSVHSTYVQMFIEQGIVGTILFFLAIFSVFRKMIEYNNLWAFCVIGFSLSYLINDAFEHSLFTYLGTLYFCLLGYFQGMLDKNLLNPPEKKDVKVEQVA